MAAPVNTVAPSVPATARVGVAIPGDTGTWTGSPTFEHQWERSQPVTNDGAYVTHEGAIVNADWEDIAGATTIGRTPTVADFGNFLRHEVTATNGDGSAVARSDRVGLVAAAGGGGGGGGGGLGGVGMAVSGAVAMLEEDED